jgi:hypothetical protein
MNGKMTDVKYGTPSFSERFENPPGVLRCSFNSHQRHGAAGKIVILDIHQHQSLLFHWHPPCSRLLNRYLKTVTADLRRDNEEKERTAY